MCRFVVFTVGCIVAYLLQVDNSLYQLRFSKLDEIVSGRASGEGDAELVRARFCCTFTAQSVVHFFPAIIA
jgi:hypothetical protein